jgi:hypothetical protein
MGDFSHIFLFLIFGINKGFYKKKNMCDHNVEIRGYYCGECGVELDSAAFKFKDEFIYHCLECDLYFCKDCAIECPECGEFSCPECTPESDSSDE